MVSPLVANELQLLPTILSQLCNFNKESHPDARTIRDDVAKAISIVAILGGYKGILRPGCDVSLINDGQIIQGKIEKIVPIQNT